MINSKDRRNSFFYLVVIVLLASSIVACLSEPSVPAQVNKSPPAPELPKIKLPTIVAFEVSPTKVTTVETVTLRWEVTGADTVVIDQGIGQVSLSGTKKLVPVQSVVYKLTAINAGGSVTRTASVVAYENAVASKIALTDEDVKAAGFSYRRNTEPTIDNTISTYSIMFIRRGYVVGVDEVLDNTVSVHTTVAATEKRYIETKGNAKGNVSSIVIMGDEGYALKIPGGEQNEPATYVIRFRKNNVYVNLGTISNYKELESFAKIVEARIK
jgi:hypothetical protein